MIDQPPAPELPRSPRRRTVWPNLVWAVPVAALLIVAYLGIEAISHRGEVVTVTFDRAAGARAGETKVLYQGVEAGRVTRIELNKDGRSVDFKLRLLPEAKAGLTTNARFWLIGATPTFTDLASLKAVLFGVAIGYAPGEGGTPTTTFQGLDNAPVILPSDKGTRYHLAARQLSSIREGSVVLFHGQLIGKVTQLKFDGKEGFRLEIFVYQPYDSLITARARFWKISPLRLSFRDGITANLAPASALLAGGIEVSLAPVTGGSEQDQSDKTFILYESHAAALQGLSGPTVSYEFSFFGAAGALEPDAAVTLLGFQIGAVQSVRLAYDEHTGQPYATAIADIYPEELNLPGPTSGSSRTWRSIADEKLKQLARAGYRAELQQHPALLGDESIALVKMKGVPPADLKITASSVEFPTAQAGGDFAELAPKASELLTNLNSVPFDTIGNNLRVITERLREVIGSPKLTESLARLDSTLGNLNQILNDARPQVGPLLERLNETARQLVGVTGDARELLRSNGEAEDANLREAIRELTEAARSIRSLTDYLSRHPEALIRGKRDP
jgi:paraquat-inducible protein B